MKILWWDISLISTLDKNRHLMRQLALNAPPYDSLLLKYSNPKFLTGYLKEVFPHTKVVHGKKGQGDIVVVNMEPNEWLTLEEYLKPILPVYKVETAGIYTNIYLDRGFYQRMLNLVLRKG